MTRITIAAAATLLLGAATGLAACTPVEETEISAQDATLAGLDTSRACFQKRQINGYANASDGSAVNERIVLDVSIGESWLLETAGACPDLDFSRRLALDTVGSTSVCTGDLETLLVPSDISGVADRCPVRVLGRLRED